MKKILFILLLLVAAIFGGVVMIFSSTPKYIGEFKWIRVVVVGDPRKSQGVETKVFGSIDKLHEIFSLSAGDECFYLTGEEWVWRDKKDPAFSLVPIFCPTKGGGWAMPPSESALKAS